MLMVALALSGLGGCTFGPKALEKVHRPYNDAVKRVAEEQMLLNIVRLRYNDDPTRLDVSSIAAQFELDTSAEARPFFATESNSAAIASFSQILPFVGGGTSDRPTISLTPLDDPESIRGLFVPATLDSIAFLAETSWPVETIFRAWVEHANRTPNAATASGPTRAVVPEYQEFQRATAALQGLQDRGDARIVREEKLTPIGSPLAPEAVTMAGQIEAAKSGYEYRQNADKTWSLVRRDRRLMLKINPAALDSPEVAELCRDFELQPGRSAYEVTVGNPNNPFSQERGAPGSDKITVYPRSFAQALSYLAHGVIVPADHIVCGLARATVEPDGRLFDWQQVTGGLFTVHCVKQHHRPACAHIAVRYRDYWFYIDDRDQDTKETFALMMIMGRVNLFTAKKGGPAFTLPVGR